MERRNYTLHSPRGQSVLLVASILSFADVACAFPGQVQTVPRVDAAKLQRNEASATPNGPKKTPSRAPARQHLGVRANPSGADQSRLAVGQPSGLSRSASMASPDATVQNFGGDRMRALERQMWALINLDRSNPETFGETGGRAQPLNWNERLAEVARAHSLNMVEQGFFAHVDPEGKTFEMRLDEAGIPWWAAGENIAINGTVVRAEIRLMNEARFQPNHRYNILNTFFTDVGIGIVLGPDGSLYITQVFVQTPRRRGFKSAP